MFEVLNFLFIYRWLTNIKIDIIKFIRLIKHQATSLATPCLGKNDPLLQDDLDNLDEMLDFDKQSSQAKLSLNKFVISESLQNLIWQKNFEDFGIDFEVPNDTRSQKSILSSNIFGINKQQSEFLDSERSPLL